MPVEYLHHILPRDNRSWKRLKYSNRTVTLIEHLRATSDTLPTAINLWRWSIQCDSKCLLCDFSRPTTAHVLNGCPVTLNQQHYTYCHNQMLSARATMLTKAIADCQSIQVFNDLQNH